MNGEATAPKLIERRRVGFGGIPLDTPPLAAGSFILRLKKFFFPNMITLTSSPCRNQQCPVRILQIKKACLTAWEVLFFKSEMSSLLRA